MAKYLICRPQGGLNDILCQSEICYRYSQKYSRILFIDTNFENSIHFRESISNYFDTTQENVNFFDHSTDSHLWSKSIYPEFLQTSNGLYEFFFSDQKRSYLEENSMQPITFDQNSDYPHEVLIHHSGGGGIDSIKFLSRLTLKNNIFKKLQERIVEIGAPYIAVHIRNTDYKSDYQRHIKKLEDINISYPIVICSDSAEAIDYCKSYLHDRRVISFSQIKNTSELPLHVFSNESSKDLIENSNLEAILDLFTLSLSAGLIVLPLNNVGEFSPDKYSGFSQLAWNLSNHKKIIKKILGLDNYKLVNFSDKNIYSSITKTFRDIHPNQSFISRLKLNTKLYFFK